MGLFYYFRFVLNRFVYIVIASFSFILNLKLKSQDLDSLKVINSKYDSILKTESLGIERLFYKHHDDVLINNIGPYGSKYYYPTSSFLYRQSLLSKSDVTNEAFRRLNGVKPFTNLTYINASRREQIFKIKHLQHFGKQLLFSFDLNKVSSPGAFVNQEANNGLFDISLSYKSKKGNYNVTINSEIQRDFFQENGGVASSEDFSNNRFDDAQNYSVNLFSSNSFVKRYKYSIEQKLDLFPLNTDSVNPSKLFMSHDVSYETYKRVFNDNDANSPIYNSVYLDSNKVLNILMLDSIQSPTDTIRFDYLNSLTNHPTIDSTYRQTLSNTVGLGLRNKKTRYELIYQYDVKDYYQGFSLDTISRYIDTNYTNSYAGFRTSTKLKSLKLEGVFKYGVSGYRTGDVLGEVQFTKKFKKTLLNINGGYFLVEPDLKLVNYLSNHYQWQNYNFNKQSVLSVNSLIQFEILKLDVSIETKLLNNALFYDSLSLASQNNEAISFTSLRLGKEYSFWRFYFRTAGIYQVTSNQYIAPLPQFIARQVVYYQTRVFKKALKVQLGVGGSYSTDYYGFGYSPAISEFYSQSNQTMGYYPSIDIFLNTYLKRAQIFLKWEHFNAGRSNSKSFLAPGYPTLPRSLKFGVSWNMFD